MNAVTLLRNQLAWAHHTLEATVADTKDKALHFTDTGKALSVGAAYAHAVLEEDIVVATMFTHKKPLSQGNKNTGVSEPIPDFSEWEKHETWAKNVKIDLPKLQAFAKKVSKQTDTYLAGLTDEDLDQEIERPMIGKQTLAFFISTFVILHIANLAGEISAAKGMQGLKGYPF